MKSVEKFSFLKNGLHQKIVLKKRGGRTKINYF
jgi:hypothetical protein